MLFYPEYSVKSHYICLEAQIYEFWGGKIYFCFLITHWNSKQIIADVFRVGKCVPQPANSIIFISMKIQSGPLEKKMISVSEIIIQTERDNNRSNQMRRHQPSLHLGEKLRNLPRDDIVHLLGVVHPRQ